MAMLTPAWKAENAAICMCNGSDDYCPCQNDEFLYRPSERPVRYEARDDCVLDSFGGARSFRIVPIMGQSADEAIAFARLVAHGLNRSDF